MPILYNTVKEDNAIYVGLQTLVFMCGGGTIDLSYPCWILWYLLSLSCWLCFVLVWLKFLKGKCSLVILIISIIVGCVVGYVSFIDRRFSLSRTLVFFPYFWLGVILDCKTEWKKYRFIGMAALLFGILITVLTENHLTVNFLYHAEPYDAMQNGATLRLACYIIGVSAIIFLLAWIPDKRFIFTKAGGNTMPAYILHSIFAVILRELYLPWYIYLMLTAIFLWIVCRVMQIKGTVYRIALLEGRRNNANFSKNI